jgi:hypothetical protein
MTVTLNDSIINIPTINEVKKGRFDSAKVKEIKIAKLRNGGVTVHASSYHSTQRIIVTAKRKATKKYCKTLLDNSNLKDTNRKLTTSSISTARRVCEAIERECNPFVTP